MSVPESGRARLSQVARGERPADLVLRGGRVADLATGRIVDGDVGMCDGRIVGVGRFEAREVIELDGDIVSPGLIDAHVHIESSMVPPDEFARAVVPHGTTTVITDPHEIANVSGLAGIRFMLERASLAPLDVYVMAPSCVPATAMESNGATLEAADLVTLLGESRVLGLAEVMNFPGVLAGDADVVAKLEAFAGRPIDGHAPGMTGGDLLAYAAAGIGSDHECTTAAEAIEKLSAGMSVFLREATNARNLDALTEIVGPATAHRLCLCTDDRTPAHLLDEGHIDGMVRRLITSGVDPLLALRLATWNPARHYGLVDRGAIAPGLRADLVVFDDLQSLTARLVLRNGEIVARAGAMAIPRTSRKARLPLSVNVDWSTVDLGVPVEGERLRVIGALRDQLLTESREEAPRVVDGVVQADPERDLVKMAVIERHRATGSLGLGFVHGLGLRRGALASTVAHDHHNLVVVGADDASMQVAARRAEALGGGLVVAAGERVLAELPLPLAGLMSDRPVEEVRRLHDALLGAAAELGADRGDPFMALSFLALEVIPSLKLTDQGLVDVERFEIVSLWAD